MRINYIRNYPIGNEYNTANGLTPIVQQYDKELFVRTLDKYLSDPGDKHCYIKERKRGVWYEYCTTIVAFDIESSSLYVKEEKRVVPYIWQIAIQDYVFYGRHFEDIVEMFNVLSIVFETNEKRRVIVWVHNLPYEFQFIRKYFLWNNVFLIDDRKPIRACTVSGIEFRCSYILSGMSLAELSKKGIHTGKVQKMVGDLDYSLIRHEKTPLTSEELKYAINDVLVDVEYITEQVNELYDGDITKLPMTKTGAVRQYVRSHTIYQEDRPLALKYADMIKTLTVEKDEYKLLKDAFSGGFTHANSKYVGMTLSKVSSADISSSYPAVICTEKFPMSKGMIITIDNDMDKFDKLKETGLMVFHVMLRGLTPIVNFEHTLQRDKCLRVRNAVVDNGRVVSADEVITTMTSVDFDMLMQFYDAQFFIHQVLYYKADYLPKDLIKSVLMLYSDKTKLKGDSDNELLYLLKKANLNSVYGMMVMSIDRSVVKYLDKSQALNELVKVKNVMKEIKDETEKKRLEKRGEQLEKIIKKDGGYCIDTDNFEEELDEYNKSKTRFLYYPWGVFVTAYARQRLQKFILRTGEDHVYSDTDSDKFLNIEKHEKDIDEFNAEIDAKNYEAAEKLGLDIDLFYPKDTIDGKRHPLGYLENETKKYGPYVKFKTIGAKRYLVEEVTKYGTEVALTCAGVNKKKGAEYIASKEDPFELFDENMYIPADKSGKTTATYIDDEHTFECTDYLGNTDICTVQSGIHIEPVSFKLKIAPVFKRFLASVENHKYILRR